MRSALYRHLIHLNIVFYLENQTGIYHIRVWLFSTTYIPIIDLYSSVQPAWVGFLSPSPTSSGHWQSCHLTQLLSSPSMPWVPARDLTLTPLAPVLPARLTSGSRLLLSSLLLMAALCLWALVALTLTWPTHVTLLGQVRHSSPTLSPILRFVGNWGTRRAWWNA